MRSTFYLALLPLLVLPSCKNGKDEVIPQVKPLMEAVYASGFVVAQNEYQVFAQVDGYLSSKMVSDGDAVKKGDPLFIIESGQQSSRFRIAKENYELALRNNRPDSPVLQELSAALESSHTKMQFDSTNYIRYTNLWKQNATAKVEFDRYKLQYENSTNEFLLQSSRYKKVKDQLQVELQNELNQLQIASDESGRYIVRSEVDGKVFKTMKEKGELVRRNEAIAIVGRDDIFYAELNIDEIDIQRIKSGQEVLIKIDAYPNTLYHAVVDKVYPMVNVQQQSLRVDASFKDSLPGTFSGLALEANIVIQQKEKALVIPKTFLLPGDSIMLKTDDGKRKIKVTRGIETLDEVEIVEGLDSASRIVSN